MVNQSVYRLTCREERLCDAELTALQFQRHAHLKHPIILMTPKLRKEAIATIPRKVVRRVLLTPSSIVPMPRNS